MNNAVRKNFLLSGRGFSQILEIIHQLLIVEGPNSDVLEVRGAVLGHVLLRLLDLRVGLKRRAGLPVVVGMRQLVNLAELCGVGRAHRAAVLGGRVAAGNV